MPDEKVHREAAGARAGTIGDVVGLADAVAQPPLDAAEATAWLRREGLVRQIGDTEVVIWPDVLDGIRGARRAAPVPVPGEVISEDRAARALPWRRADAVAWLREEGLSLIARGRRVVCWSSVLERLRPGVPPTRTSRGQSGLGPAPPLLAKPGRILDQ